MAFPALTTCLRTRGPHGSYLWICVLASGYEANRAQLHSNVLEKLLVKAKYKHGRVSWMKRSAVVMFYLHRGGAK